MTTHDALHAASNDSSATSWLRPIPRGSPIASLRPSFVGLPTPVHRDHLIDGKPKLHVTVWSAQLAAPSLSGGLSAAITAPYAIVADAISFVISTVFLTRIRKVEHLPERAEGAAKPRMWPEVKEGLNWIVRSPYLRRIAACTGSSNFFGSVGFAIFVLYALRVLHLPPWQIGLVFGASSVG